MLVFIAFNTNPIMQAKDDIVKAILGSLPTPGSEDQDGLPSFEQAIFQAENFIRAVRRNVTGERRSNTPLTVLLCRLIGRSHGLLPWLLSTLLRSLLSLCLEISTTCSQGYFFSTVRSLSPLMCGETRIPWNLTRVLPPVFLACLSQPLNGFLSNNWEKFASANYFDDSGLFLATVYSLPLIVNCMLALVSRLNFHYCIPPPMSSKLPSLDSGSRSASNVYNARQRKAQAAGKSSEGKEKCKKE